MPGPKRRQDQVGEKERHVDRGRGPNPIHLGCLPEDRNARDIVPVRGGYVERVVGTQSSRFRVSRQNPVSSAPTSPCLRISRDFDVEISPWRAPRGAHPSHDECAPGTSVPFDFEKLATLNTRRWLPRASSAVSSIARRRPATRRHCISPRSVQRRRTTPPPADAFASAFVSSSFEVSEAWHEIQKVGNKNRRVCA